MRFTKFIVLTLIFNVGISHASGSGLPPYPKTPDEKIRNEISNASNYSKNKDDIISNDIAKAHNNKNSNEISIASNYPKTRDERIREEMGSFAGDGIVFRPSHLKKSDTKSVNRVNTKVNKFLWEASRKVLENFPTTTCDASSGVIITDWYVTRAAPHYSFKIEVSIQDDVISPEAFEVKVYERRLQNNTWFNEPASAKLSLKFADEILQHARKLYISQSGQ